MPGANLLRGSSRHKPGDVLPDPRFGDIVVVCRTHQRSEDEVQRKSSRSWATSS